MMEAKMADLLRERAFVGGQWIRGLREIDVFNPASGARVGGVPALSGADASEAVAAATAAFPVWRARTALERSEILRRWRDLILANQEPLAQLITIEQGKPLKEARAEIALSAGYIAWFAEEGRRIYGETIPAQQSDRRIWVARSPVGVVAAITPWNFPSSMVARKVAPALAAGCTIVVKPSEFTPFSALALAVLAERAGLDSGALNVITGDPGPIGEVLLDDKRVKKFTFTGSTATGKRLAARAMLTVKRVSLELGGNAPFIVFDDADLDEAVDGLMVAKFRNSGQTCICANRVFVQAGIHDAFVARLAARVATLKVGDGAAPDTDQGPLINASAVAKAQRHVEDARSRGAKVLIGGAVADAGDNYFEPTLITEVGHDALLANEETFAPVAGIIRFRAEAEVVAFANSTDAGLAAYVYTCDLARAHRVSEALEYGMVGLNTGLMTTEVAPFGGVKESGFGREGSHFGLDDYLDLKAVCMALPRS